MLHLRCSSIARCKESSYKSIIIQKWNKQQSKRYKYASNERNVIATDNIGSLWWLIPTTNSMKFTLDFLLTIKSNRFSSANIFQSHAFRIKTNHRFELPQNERKTFSFQVVRAGRQLNVALFTHKLEFNWCAISWHLRNSVLSFVSDRKMFYLTFFTLNATDIFYKSK